MRHFSFEEQESARRLALDSHDAPKYARLCDAIGIPEHSIEDLELYERGHDLISIDKIFASRALRANATAVDTSPYAELTKMVLRRFPPDVSDKGLRRRASEISHAGAVVGYHLKPYSKMRRDELFTYLTGEVHKDVAKIAREHCPEVLDGIRRQNAEMKLIEVFGR